MKAYKIITIITIIILVAILEIAAFMGVFKLKDYKVRNIIPSYVLGKEFSKSVVVDATVSDEIESTKIYDKDGNEITDKKDGVEYTEENGYKTVEIQMIL